MLTVSCRDVGKDCDYVCKGETEEELMKNAEGCTATSPPFKLKSGEQVSVAGPLLPESHPQNRTCWNMMMI